MTVVSINKQVRLSDHFTLGEMCKTSAKTQNGNIPSHVHIENLKRLCRWLERLRQKYNLNIKEKIKNKNDEPIIINSGYRSPAVNKAVGGAQNSNHLTGCAADIRCLGIEQALRYATTLLDISDESKEDFDELLIEKSTKSIWVHFAVRPMDNRRKVKFLKK
jgi:uncharacterized protein YcbK (DUF882 family)